MTNNNLNAVSLAESVPINSAPKAILEALEMTRHDVLDEINGAPFKCESDGFTHVRFTRPGVLGYFYATIKVEHIQPFGVKP